MSIPGKGPGSSVAHMQKTAQIDAVLNDVIRRYEAGSPVDAADIERAHPELMPQLGERLRALRGIQEAKERALGTFRERRSQATNEAWLQEDLEFLRASLNNYDVLEYVRFGGQGVVYKARQKKANRLVAIKVLLDGPLASERQRYRFEREIELISRLRHPNIVTLYDTGTVRGRRYFAMESVEGLPIHDYVILHDLTPREIVRLFIKVCRAISFAHQNGVIHRDLSPANILIDEAGEPHVFDFGLAKDVWASDDVRSYTFTGQVIGTLQYLSPEQAGGLDGKVDVRSDIYTLGVVLYELLTDGFPYPVRGEPRQVCEAIRSVEPEPLRRATARGEKDRIRDPDTINRDLESILTKALAKEKDRRYQSAVEFADDLERCLAGDAVTARVDSSFYLLRKTIRRYRLSVTVAGVILLTFGVSAIAVTASWLQARRDRDNARQAVHVAYDLFDTAMTDLEKAVRPLAGGVAVRDRMISGLADRLPQLETLVESDVTLDDVSTRLAEKQGDLAVEQGERSEAARHYRVFLDGSRRRAELFPTSHADLDRVVQAYRKYAPLSADPALFYKQGIQSAEMVLVRDAGRPAARYNLCQLHVGFGEYLYGLERFDEALAHFDRALDACPTADDESSDAVEWLRARAFARSRRGSILLILGQGEAGFADLTASLEIQKRVVGARPADTISRHDFMLSQIYVAKAYRDAGQVDEAKQLLNEAIVVGELLRRMDPTVERWRRDLYAAYDILIRLLLQTGSVDQAQDLCGAAVALAEERVGEDPDSRRLLSFARVLQGRVLLAGQAPEQAYKTFLEAAAIRESLLHEDPGNLAYQDDYAVVHGWLGMTSRRMDEPAQAAGHYQVGYDIRRRLHALQPATVERVLDLVTSQTNLATAHMDGNTEADNAAAAGLLREAEGLLAELHAGNKLVGLEHRYEVLMSAIQTNQRIIQKGAEQKNDPS